MIFVSIASYRDPELEQTIQSVLHRAANIDNIRIGVCQQDYPEYYLKYPSSNIEILYYDPIESQGAGWARAQTNSLYRGEKYFMQIDSHIEMVDRWDQILIGQYHMAQYMTERPIVMASYPVLYTLNDDNTRELASPQYYSTKIKFIKDTNILEGEAVCLDLKYPVPAKYLNAGFMFGAGQYIAEHPGDPEIYFWGEEICNTAKAYTSGYDLFHPGAHICWHNYSRPKERQHWNTADEKIRDVKWYDRDRISRQKVIDILNGNRLDCLGTVRTLEQFENYLNVDFKNRIIKE